MYTNVMPVTGFFEASSLSIMAFRKPLQPWQCLKVTIFRMSHPGSGVFLSYIDTSSDKHKTRKTPGPGETNHQHVHTVV